MVIGRVPETPTHAVLKTKEKVTQNYYNHNSLRVTFCHVKQFRAFYEGNKDFQAVTHEIRNAEKHITVLNS